MAIAPYRVIDRRSSMGWAGNQLYVGATQSTDRKSIPNLDHDWRRNITPQGRRTLMTLGRRLYSSCGPVRGVLNEMATYASSSWIPQFYGQDKAWGELAEAWLYEHDKICDIRGWPFSMATLRRNLIIGILRDGDAAILLTETPDGYPLFQCLPGHRVGSGGLSSSSLIESGAFSGSILTDGIISDDTGRSIGYRLTEDSVLTNGTFRDVAAGSLLLCYLPEYSDQVRGVSTLGSSVVDWQDIDEVRRFELLAQKAGSTVAMMETNETGQADPAKALLQSPASFDATNQLTAPAVQSIDGGAWHYFKSNSGSKLEPFRNDRPPDAATRFWDSVMRQAMHGMGWSFDFSLDPSKVGGAPFRVIVDKINRTVGMLQSLVLEPTCRRLDGYRVAKAIKLGQLPASTEWWKWTYQGPALITADKKYDSDVSMQEMDAGVKSLAKSCAERGDYWEDVMIQREIEAADLLARAKRLSATSGVPIELCITLLRKPTPNGVPAAAQPQQPQQENQASA
jgi:hypothetical protein